MLNYEIEAMEVALKLSNRELYDEVINMAGGNIYGGSFTTKGFNIYLVYKDVLEKRLSSWFGE